MGSRVRAFDWLRGLAVVVMIQCHSLAVLRPELLAGPFFRNVNFIDGLVAPAFLLAAGFSLALVQVRGARAGHRTERAKKTLFRILEVLAVATLINAFWFFPIWKTPHRLLRLDILHCVGLSLLLAFPLVVALARRPLLLASACFVLCVPFFAVAPLLEGVDVGHLGGQFLNRASDSTFPLFPWTGYVLLGASVGAVGAGQGRAALAGYLLGLSALGYWLWTLKDAQVALYPPHHFWETGPSQCAVRVFWVGLLTVGFLGAERWMPSGSLTTPPVQLLEAFGTKSLSAYFFHQAFLFMLGPWSLASKKGLWPRALDWPQYWLVTLLLVILTYASVMLLPRVTASRAVPRALRAR